METTATVKLQIDPVIEAFFPPLEKAETVVMRQAMVANPLAIEPIRYWRDGGINWVIDGHHRLVAARILNVHIYCLEMKFKCRHDAIEYVLMNQLGRRNLPPADRARMMLELSKHQTATGRKAPSLRDVAAAAGVSRMTVARVKDEIANNATRKKDDLQDLRNHSTVTNVTADCESSPVVELSRSSRKAASKAAKEAETPVSGDVDAAATIEAAPGPEGPTAKGLLALEGWRAWRDGHHLHLLNEIVKDVPYFAKTSAGAWLNDAQLVADLRNAGRLIKAALPCASCGTCGGTGKDGVEPCRECKGGGWITKLVYDQMRQDQKERCIVLEGKR